MGHHRLLITTFVFILIAAPALAQAEGDHDMHRGHKPSASPEGGAWSYIDRDNPAAPKGNRWTVVPGGGAAFVDARGLSEAERCAALARAGNVAIDGETRARCGLSGALPAEAAPMPMNGDAGHGH